MLVLVASKVVLRLRGAVLIHRHPDASCDDELQHFICVCWIPLTTQTWAGAGLMTLPRQPSSHRTKIRRLDDSAECSIDEGVTEASCSDDEGQLSEDKEVGLHATCARQQACVLIITPASDHLAALLSGLQVESICEGEFAAACRTAWCTLHSRRSSRLNSYRGDSCWWWWWWWCRRRRGGRGRGGRGRQ